MSGSRATVEPIDDRCYRITFGRPVEADVALMYFGFYPDVRLFWKDGRVTSVVAPVDTYERIVADFAVDAPPDDDASAIDRAAGLG